MAILSLAQLASQAVAQSAGLPLVESAPATSPVSQTQANTPASPQFIRQPSKVWQPEKFSEPALSTFPPSVFQLVSDPVARQKPSLADLALPQAADKVSDKATGNLPESAPAASSLLPNPQLPNPQSSTQQSRSPSLSEFAIPGDASTTRKQTNAQQDLTGLGEQPPTAPGAETSSPSSPEPSADKQSGNKTTMPSFFFPPPQAVQYDCNGRAIPYSGSDFAALPMPALPLDPYADAMVYRGKTPITTQRPWVELGRPLYTPGLYPPANSFFFGETNLLMPHFYVYGDYRTGVGVNENQSGAARSWAHRLNLDMDLQFTATERLHAFMGPLDRNNDVTRLDFSNGDDITFLNRTDLRLDTLFFEGDVGAILGGREGTYSPFDLPFSVGLLPLVYQNGIWMEDAMLGAAFAIPSRHSSVLDWSNYEVSLFALTDQVTTDAFLGDNNAAEVFGSAWFIEAYGGYIEAGHAFIHDDVGGHRSYHNATIAYTRRYLSRLSNSVRVITNFGQALPSDQRTADGYLILLENSLISSNPNYFVPYANFFYGSGKPQSVARAGVSGGILRNTGINFETDLLTGYPTLDATGNNTYGAAFGLNMLGSNFTHQLVLEFAALAATGSQQFRVAPGDQYAAGVRYQKPLSHRWIFRADTMYGWLRNSEDIFGNRIEFRWKF
ncbi:MAG: hypothetical protein SFV81_27610 [Pirellulaceae bacterium]|nr:hypothetical protein [Pirellulaceae bacterium]